jgi:multidrug efflux pump subunit AcrB
LRGKRLAYKDGRIVVRDSPWADLLNVNFLSNGRLIRLRDIATIRRGYSDPPQPMFRVNGKPAIGLAIAMRDGGDILTLGRNVKKAIDQSVADLPLGIDASLSSVTSRSSSRPPSASSWNRSGRRSPSSWRSASSALA